ncbi:unnamed protein product [Somion occarium]|uniref:Ubiquitin-like protease family profile domain-containing protein n=1 Tax=Somion occarium TaxID=3059160 RepID=A0ABP1DXL1_9APHY
MNLNGRDKESSRNFQAMSSGLPSSMRDASGNRAGPSREPGPWKTRPTPVPVPTPGSMKTPTSRGAATNPFSGRMGTTLTSGGGLTSRRGNASTKASGNTTAKAIVFERPIKRQKVDHPQQVEPSSSRFFANPSTSSYTRPSSSHAGLYDTSASAPEIIDIDDEDRGVIVNRVSHPRNNESSDDELLLTSPRPKLHDFEMSPSEPERRLAPDGEDTKRLQRKIELKGKMKEMDIIHVDDDPIEQFSDEPRVHPAAKAEVPVGIVKQKAAIFDAKPSPASSGPTIRQLDLRNVSVQKGPVKSSMKPRSQKLEMQPVVTTTQKDVFATASSFESARRMSVKTNGRKAEIATALPLEAWTLGTQMHQSEDRLYWLLVDSNGKLSINKGLPGITLFSVALRDLSKYKRSKHEKDDFPILLKLWFKKSRSKTHNTDNFQMGSVGENGCVTLKFLTRHSNWQNGSSYVQLLNLLETYDAKFETLDQYASKSAWEVTQNAIALDNQTSVSRPRSPAISAAEHHNDPPGPPQSKRLDAPIPVRPTRVTRARQKELEQEPETERRSADADKLILVYPFSGTGAVNITRGDWKRLQPGEYLNDTLIEFGLKLWLEEVRREKPELADQIHVFSSFFYKKINVRNKEQGYQSVRKWTSKIDLFSKKYIIVPINEHLHWYLAIICNPEYILREPPLVESVAASKPMTRKRKRHDDILEAELKDSSQPQAQESSSMAASVSVNFMTSRSRPVSPKNEVVPDSEEERDDKEHDDSGTQSTKKADDEGETMEVETMLERSCSLNELEPPRRDSSPLSSISDMQLAYPTDLDLMEIDKPTVEEDTTTAMESRDSVSSISRAEPRPEFSPEIEYNPSDSASRSGIGPVPPSLFYASSANTKGKAREENVVDVENVDIEEPPGADEEEEPVVLNHGEPQPERTYIFTFDSLGSEHKAVVRTLSKYLQLEAKDKKGLENTSEALGKQALVPYQPNYCDCGVYVLHFVARFLSDPERYTRLILSKTKKSEYQSSERDKDWGHEIVGGMRDGLSRRIEELSIEWQKFSEEKGKREAQLKADGAATSTGVTSVEDSDDEVIVEEGPKSSARKGKAMRIR